MNLEQMKILCETDTEDLKSFLYRMLVEYDYKEIIRKPNYIIAEGNTPVCLIAHVDTVFDQYRFYVYEEGFEWFYDSDKNVLWKPLGSGYDDRAGIYSIFKILQNGFRPHIIFTDKEEIGGIGAQQLIKDFPQCPFNICNFIIQLDRRGEKDAVFYQCDNKDFMKYITKFGFKEANGTFSDISFIAPQWGIAAVNLSVGYYQEHTESEYLNCDYCDSTIEKVKKILMHSQRKELAKTFIYVPKDIRKMTKADTVIGF